MLITLIDGVEIMLNHVAVLCGSVVQTGWLSVIGYQPNDVILARLGISNSVGGWQTLYLGIWLRLVNRIRAWS